MSASISDPSGTRGIAGESSSTSEPSDPAADEAHSESDPVANHGYDDAILSNDPLGDLGNGFVTPTSFKRKPKHQSRFSLSNLWTSSAVPSARSDSSFPSDNRRRNESNVSLTHNVTQMNGGLHGTKEGGSADWYVEGPGRRVGYDDLTAIDWIFEYNKERQRQRILHSTTPGLVGYLRQLLDASHVWLVLVMTGIAVGVLAAFISIASDWLGDIKSGYCKRGDGGGQFYLNKGFCCWGHEELGQCQDWTPWREALRIPNKGGGYVVEFIFYVLYSVLFAIAASILVQQYATYAKHSGIPEIKTVLGGFVIRRFMGAWTLVTKSLGLCLAVASGLWLGKEGPLVHVACCCANLIMKPFPSISLNEARKREILSAAAASGISVAFGSPIGGVLFSLEQLSYYFPDKTMWQSFVCAMVAAVTLQAFNPFRTGKIVLYQVTYSSGWHAFELVPFILLGITGGLYGGLFIRGNMRVAKFYASDQNPLRNRPVLQVFLVAVLTSMINYVNVFMRAQTSELVSTLFAECASLTPETLHQLPLCKTTTAGTVGIITLLLTASLLAILLAMLTFGLQIPAGIILPSLAIGALYGRALGIFTELVQNRNASSLIFSACEPDIPCITAGTYAIVGAASALAGVTRLTVSIVVIVFELTGALTYVLPLMIAVMLSKWIGDAISKRGIYESWIALNEYPFLDNRDDTPAPDLPVSAIMTRFEDLVCLAASDNHTIASITQILETPPKYRGFPVISSQYDPILLGYISRTELKYALQLATQSPFSISQNSNVSSPPLHNHQRRQNPLPPSTHVHLLHDPSADPRTSLDLRPWMDQTPLTLSASSRFQLAVDMFQKLGLRYLLFVDKGRLRGLCTKKDLWWVIEGMGERWKERDALRREEINIEAEEDGDGEAEGLLRGDSRRSE